MTYSSTYLLFHSFCRPEAQAECSWLSAQRITRSNQGVIQAAFSSGAETSLAVVELRSLFVCWLWAESCSQFLETAFGTHSSGALRTRQLTSQSQWGNLTQEGLYRHLCGIMQPNQGSGHPIILTGPRLHLHSRVGDCTQTHIINTKPLYVILNCALPFPPHNWIDCFLEVNDILILAWLTTFIFISIKLILVLWGLCFSVISAFAFSVHHPLLF